MPWIAQSYPGFADSGVAKMPLYALKRNMGMTKKSQDLRGFSFVNGTMVYTQRVNHEGVHRAVHPLTIIDYHTFE